jgi:transcriptional regulator with PAS, ATPase and Fis domain
MKTKIAIVGAGRGGSALVNALFFEPMVKITGVIDINPKAVGVQRLKSLNIPFYTNVDDFKAHSKTPVDFVFNLSGDKRMDVILRQKCADKSKIVSGFMSKFIWDLIDQKNQKEELETRYLALKKELKSELEMDELIFGNNQQMQQIKILISKVAATPTTVLLTGETGTGKEVIADAIYENSHLKDQIFLKINCTAISSELLESEFFGHKKGAFTGAIKDKVGIFERANGGTVFLDEIGDLSLQMQAKLLRFLQFGEIKPVGCYETKKVKTRIITATNRNLEVMIRENKFRSDLYYRINTMTIHIPPLRERKEDIPLYAYFFLKKNMKKINKKVTSISSEALDYLNNYSWPGNLRELNSVIERSVVLSSNTQIDVSDLTQVLTPNTNNTNYLKDGIQKAREQVINEFEIKAIQFYLNDTSGNITKAAQLAHLPRRSFYRLLEKHKIKGEIFKR